MGWSERWCWRHRGLAARCAKVRLLRVRWEVAARTARAVVGEDIVTMAGRLERRGNPMVIRVIIEEEGVRGRALAWWSRLDDGAGVEALVFYIMNAA